MKTDKETEKKKLKKGDKVCFSKLAKLDLISHKLEFDSKMIVVGHYSEYGVKVKKINKKYFKILNDDGKTTFKRIMLDFHEQWVDKINYKKLNNKINHKFINATK